MRSIFSDINSAEYLIIDEVLNRIKTLKSKVVASGYYEYLVEWNSDFVDDYITMQFLSMLGKPNDELIEKYDLNNPNKGYLMSLLRLLYLDFGENEKWQNCIMMGYKRPFGNSNVLGDVREELERCGVLERSDEDDDNYDLEDKCLKEFSEFVIDFFKSDVIIQWYGFEKSAYNYDNFKYKEFSEFWKKQGVGICHSYLADWHLSKSEIRDRKLTKILTNDI